MRAVRAANRRTCRRSRWLPLFAALLGAVLATPEALAATPLSDTASSPDITLTLSAGPTTVLDHRVVGEGPSVVLDSLDSLTAAVVLTAVGYATDGDPLFSPDVPIDLEGTLYLASDVLRFDTTSETPL